MMSLSIANNDKSLSLVSGILSHAVVLMSFILLNVRSVVVDDTGSVIAPVSSDMIVGKVCGNGRVSKYKSIIFFDFYFFNIGFNTSISLFSNTTS